MNIDTTDNIRNANERGLKEECRRSIRRLSMGSSFIPEGRTILDDDQNRVAQNDIEEGLELGQGNFSKVREVKSFRRNSMGASICSSTVSESFQPCVDPESRSYYYAVKKVRKDLSEARIHNATVDLVVEAQFLTSLSHQHIVSLEGVGDDPGSKDFFIILEKLDRTLANEIFAWKKEASVLKKIHCRDERKLSIKRRRDKHIEYARDLSSALAYLHDKNMIFRDLKPENVGFTHDNMIKLFDLGLARELKEERKVGRDKYLLSLCGTRRYMAPEVMKGSPYGLPADVFSFSLLLWEMVHTEKPFRNLDAKQHERALVLWRSRPKVSGDVPRAVKSIIVKSWNNDAKNRPRMIDVFDSIH
ncbi:hypothetical protein CTEN210_15129 [Chaetoceros tenuissimus]|uniref:Protein kinase domain-containing protein n=1 Tax=Chaetoceros tenuissimus TaxID=426638 RepID=A0AAD3HD28_9STRA|nr:hypothetical protein CTEN210_15129 [Chaetoceros tenuissimus]